MTERLQTKKHMAIDGLKWLGRGAALAAAAILPSPVLATAKSNLRADLCARVSSRVNLPADVLKEAGILQSRVRRGKSVGFNAAINSDWAPDGSGRFKCVTRIPLEQHVDGRDWLFAVQFRKNHGVSSAVVNPLPYNHADGINQLASQPDSPQVNSPTTERGVLLNYDGHAYVREITYDNGTKIVDPFVAETLDLQQ